MDGNAGAARDVESARIRVRTATMITATTTRPMTADELLAMPRGDFRCELVRGELRKYPFAGWVHGRQAARITASLGLHVEANRLGETRAAGTGFELASDHVRAPDAAFVRKERADALMGSECEDGFFPGPPDLAVEVIERDDRYIDVEEKIADWLAAGTQAVVVTNPCIRTVEIRRSPTDIVVLNEGDILEVQDVVPGWRMAVSEIFRVRSAESNRNS